MFQDGYDQFRVMDYNGCDVIVVCFCVANVTSLRNVEKHWYNELRQHAPNTPFVLVGTKTDLRRSCDTDLNNQNSQHHSKLESVNFVTQKRAQKVAKRLGAECYVECSALKGEGINEVFGQISDLVANKTARPGWKRKSKSKKEIIKKGLATLFCGFSRAS